LGSFIDRHPERSEGSPDAGTYLVKDCATARRSFAQKDALRMTLLGGVHYFYIKVIYIHMSDNIILDNGVEIERELAVSILKNVRHVMDLSLSETNYIPGTLIIMTFYEMCKQCRRGISVHRKDPTLIRNNLMEHDGRILKQTREIVLSFVIINNYHLSIIDPPQQASSTLGMGLR